MWWEKIKNKTRTTNEWIALSANPSITIDRVKEMIDAPWDWDYLSMNPGITCDAIKSHPDLPWNWYSVSHHPDLTTDLIDALPDKPWCDWIIRKKKSDEFAWLHRYPLYKNTNWEWGTTGAYTRWFDDQIRSNDPADWGRKTHDPITLNHYEKAPMMALSSPNMPLTEYAPDKMGHLIPRQISSIYAMLSQRDDLTYEYVTANPHQYWYWPEICANKKIVEWIETPDGPWLWQFVSANPNVTWEIVERLPEKNWNWERLYTTVKI